MQGTLKPNPLAMPKKNKTAARFLLEARRRFILLGHRQRIRFQSTLHSENLLL